MQAETRGLKMFLKYKTDVEDLDVFMVYFVFNILSSLVLLYLFCPSNTVYGLCGLHSTLMLELMFFFFFSVLLLRSVSLGVD